ncbi:MAG: ABC transporter permease, partial [Bacteroidales bacterium]|nr:ABC transporter permease [Bacteroidales bacterium]
IIVVRKTVPVAVDSEIYHNTLVVEMENHGGVELSLINEIRTCPAVKEVAYTNHEFYFPQGNSQPLILNDSLQVWVKLCSVSKELNELFDLKLISGRWFEDNNESNSIVVNREFIDKYYGLSPALGENIETENGEVYTIVGVVENSLFTDTEKTGDKVTHSRPLVYQPYSSMNQGQTYLYIRLEKETEISELSWLYLIKNKYLSEKETFFPAKMKDVHQRSIRMYDGIISLILVLGSVSLIICLLSIYSAIQMNTQKRKKEIAIRKINGAEVKDILSLFSRKYIILWSIICMIVFPLSLIYSRLSSPLLNLSVDKYLIVFGCVYWGIALLILLTNRIQLLRVARVDPAEVLKSDN